LQLDESADDSLTPTGDAAGQGKGEVIDWLVKMRRLPADRTLVELHKSRQLRNDDLDVLAATLAEFYRRATRLTIAPELFRGEVERHVRANSAELFGKLNNVETDVADSAWLTTVKRVHAAQLQLLKLRPDFFEKRLLAGRVMEGHGDLRPEHIYFLPEPVVIDCIEFSRQFRQLDVADELSFLVTECDYIGAPKTGRHVADQCLEALRDAPPVELLAFYRCYRACVRAKVALLRSRQLDATHQPPEVAHALRHLALANDYAHELLSRMSPLLAVVHGLPGSGKSTLAKALAGEFGAELLSTDTIRRQMFGPSSAPADFNSGIYERHLRLKIYHSLIESADAFLQQGIPVILDGAFPWIEVRREAAAMAARHSAKAVFFRCCCPESVALDCISRRLAAGNSLSEVRPELYARQRAEEESSPADLKSLDIDTTVPMIAQLETVLDHLKINAV
jgi:hypothetical protein